MMGITKTITWGDVEKYQRLRETSRKLMSRMTKTIPRAAYEEIGVALGIMRKGILVFDTEDVAAVLADCCLHDWIREGRNLIMKYSLEHPASPGTDDEFLLRAHQQAQFRILVPGSVAPGAGLECADGLLGGAPLPRGRCPQQQCAERPVLDGDPHSSLGWLLDDNRGGASHRRQEDRWGSCR